MGASVNIDVIQAYARELLANHPVLAIMLASLPTIAPLAVSIWLKHKDTKQAGNETDEKRSSNRGKMLDDQQANLNSEQARWFALLRDENAVLRQMVKDREHWLDVARAWYSRSHDLLIMLRETYYEASILIIWIKSNPSLTNVPPINMDKFDVEKLPATPISIEDIGK